MWGSKIPPGVLPGVKPKPMTSNDTETVIIKHQVETSALPVHGGSTYKHRLYSGLSRPILKKPRFSKKT